jgi:hypothetical protein
MYICHCFFFFRSFLAELFRRNVFGLPDLFPLSLPPRSPPEQSLQVGQARQDDKMPWWKRGMVCTKGNEESTIFFVHEQDMTKKK